MMIEDLLAHDPNIEKYGYEQIKNLEKTYAKESWRENFNEIFYPQCIVTESKKIKKIG